MKAKIKLVSVLFVATILSLQALAGAATPSSILVVPARARMVQFAFQIAAVKDAGIISYGSGVDTSEILLHVWNGQEWIRITTDDFTSGSFMAGTAEHVFLIGPAKDLPGFMTADPTWGRTIHRMASMDIATLVNEMGKILKLTPRQWKWLAEKNNLTLTDNNADRRRYGRWGRSGIDASVIPPRTTPRQVDAVIMPPATSVQGATETVPMPPSAPATPVVTPPAAPAVTPPASPALESTPMAPAVQAPVDPTSK